MSYYIWEHHQSSAIDVWLAKIEKDRGLDALFLGCFHQWVTYLQLDGSGATAFGDRVASRRGGGGGGDFPD